MGPTRQQNPIPSSDWGMQLLLHTQCQGSGTCKAPLVQLSCPELFSPASTSTISLAYEGREVRRRDGSKTKHSAAKKTPRHDSVGMHWVFDSEGMYY